MWPSNDVTEFCGSNAHTHTALAHTHCTSAQRALVHDARHEPCLLAPPPLTGLLVLISNSRIARLPAAAKYCLSGMISNLFTCCVYVSRVARRGSHRRAPYSPPAKAKCCLRTTKTRRRERRAWVPRAPLHAISAVPSALETIVSTQCAHCCAHPRRVHCASDRAQRHRQCHRAHANSQHLRDLRVELFDSKHHWAPPTVE